MRLVSPLVVLSLFVAPALARAEPPADDATMIDRLLTTQAADWNAGRLAAFCSVYADDATFIAPSGLKQGRAQILARYRAKYDTAEKRGTLSFRRREVRRLGPDALSVVLEWRIARASGDAQGLSMIVLTHTKAGWRIVQDASM